MDRSLRFGIIGAMDVEVSLLHQAMAERGSSPQPHVSALAGMEFWEGVIGSVPCVVVRSGVGMVNAAACAQLLISRFDVQAIVNTGVAGSLDAAMDIGDMVVATDAVNWAMDVCNLGYEPGQTPGMPQAFPADAALSEELIRAARSSTKAAVRRGRIASADRFVRDASEKERIARVFGALDCEMEGAAIAQVCSVNHIPWAIIRAISDKADGSDAVDYPVFEEQAARDCAAVVCYLLRGEQASFLG